MQDRFSSQRGQILKALIGAVLVIIALVVAGFLRLDTDEQKHREARDHLQRLYTAEAGIEAALRALESGKAGDLGDTTRPVDFEFGSYWVKVHPETDGLYRLVGVGQVREQTRQVEVVVKLTPGEDGGSILERLSWREIDDAGN